MVPRQGGAHLHEEDILEDSPYLIFTLFITCWGTYNHPTISHLIKKDVLQNCHYYSTIFSFFPKIGRQELQSFMPDTSYLTKSLSKLCQHPHPQCNQHICSLPSKL